ncbi:hypothetical protein I7I48_05536 [Histoplasma ohiense]|nr:hypothetical protein I7I48_05536 [Histoplasma ohiense (nom. inval.)]
MRCHRCPESDAQRARRRVRKRGLFRGRIAMSAEQSVDGIGLGQTSGCGMGFNAFIKQDTLG